MFKKYSLHLLFFVAILVFLGFGLALLPAYQNQINPDAVAYLTIAKLYQSGQWGLAINGMRSPLYSWLLLPLLMAGLAPLLAAKVLSLCLGLFGMWLMHRFFISLNLQRMWHFLALLALAAIFLWLGYAVVSPDLLIALLLMAYLQAVWKIGRSSGNGPALLAGIFAGLAYLAKHYAFPFVIVHFSAHMLLLGWKYHRKAGMVRSLARSCLLTMTCFLLISGAWMLAMQQKYGPFVVSYGSEYNFAYMAPENPGHAVDWAGLVAPPHESAISIWDDPFTLKMKPWHPWDSAANLMHYSTVVRQHFSAALEIGLHFSPFVFAIFLIALWLALSPAAHASPLRPLSRDIVLAVVIYAAGYLLIMTEERYLWPIQLLLLLAGVAMIDAWNRRCAGDRITAMLLGAVLLSFAYFPVQNVVARRGYGREYYLHSREMAAVAKMQHARVASNRKWDESCYYAFHLDARYYGSCAPYRSGDEIRGALQQHRIEYFMFWGNAPAGAFAFLGDYPELLAGKVPGLLLYDLRGLTGAAGGTPAPAR